MADDKKDEKKEAEKASKKILDENDELACGFCSFSVLDQDGYAKKTKGAAVDAPWHLIKSDAETVVLRADLPSNALFYLQVSNEDGLYFYGEWWLADEGKSKTNQICNVVPKECKLIHKNLDGETTDFEVQAQMPLLKDSSSKLVAIKLSTKEQKFVTKVVQAELTVPKPLWLEWKQQRLTLWRASKCWKGEAAGGDDEKKEEKKDE
eukprot:TRINITY_DN108598_c0_g1_i1.p1 TRINITY_DN108598_c0_g1~~TRINITY_DN108598_c0_g1_i1.p1  ORF type:complete len:227 (-),score=78.60 TRINITY_DN108598_c0_g1_i1:66-686(-)